MPLSMLLDVLLDKIPFVPKLTKFLCLKHSSCDLKQGVTFTTFGLAALWIIYAISAFFDMALSGRIWSLIWCVANVVAYGAVILGMKRNNRLYLLPCLYICIFNVIIGTINGIINFATLAIFS